MHASLSCATSLEVICNYSYELLSFLSNIFPFWQREISRQLSGLKTTRNVYTSEELRESSETTRVNGEWSRTSGLRDYDVGKNHVLSYFRWSINNINMVTISIIFRFYCKRKCFIFELGLSKTIEII